MEIDNDDLVDCLIGEILKALGEDALLSDFPVLEDIIEDIRLRLYDKSIYPEE